ncbi:hypothetical protein L1887_29051 [Cichorium endivia]|nr:hypothetical protein L1887_29051 [Cichorium endivia]
MVETKNKLKNRTSTKPSTHDLEKLKRTDNYEENNDGSNLRCWTIWMRWKRTSQLAGELMYEDSSSSAGVSSRIDEIGDVCGFKKGRGHLKGGIQKKNLKKER